MIRGTTSRRGTFTAVAAVQVVIRDSWVPTAITATASVAGVLFGVWLATWLGRRSTLGVTRELRRLERQDESLLEIGRDVAGGKERLIFWLQTLEEQPIPSEAQGYNLGYNPDQIAREIPEAARNVLRHWTAGARLRVSDPVIRSIFERELPGEVRRLNPSDGEEMMEAARDILLTLKTLDDRIVVLVGPRPDDS